MMKRRIMALLLCAVMLLGMVPAVSAAAFDAVSTAGTTTLHFPVSSFTTCLTYGSPNYNYSYSSSKARLDTYGTDWWGAHHGTEYFAVDLSGGGASSGSSVYAVADGVVVCRRDAYGQIILKHTVPLTLSDGKTVYQTWYSTYVHMTGVTVSNGAAVSGGQVIGKVGATGTAAAHLHFSLSTRLHNGNATFHYYDRSGVTPTYELIMGYAYDSLNPKWVFPNVSMKVTSIDNDAMDQEAIKRFSLGTEYAPGNSKNGTQYGQSGTTAPSYTDVSHNSITKDNAILKGTCLNPSGIRITNGGVYLSTAPGAASNGKKFTDSVPSSYQTATKIPCSYDLKNECGFTLSQGTTYWYVLYVTDNGGKSYFSPEYSFTTTSTAPYYTDISLSSITDDNAVIKATCQNPAGLRITNGGLYLSAAPDAAKTGTRYTDNVLSDYQTVAKIPCGYDLKNECGYTLKPGTTYYYTLCVTDSNGKTYYSQEYSFTTTGHSHSYEGVITEPTCTGSGYTTYTCACGDSYAADEVPALGHDYEGGVCTRCGMTVPPAAPYKIANVVSGVHVYWKTTEGAVKYGLWRSETGEDGTYKWIANPTVPHFTDTTAESGKTYHYKVTSVNAAGNHSEKSSPIAVIFVSTPDITSRSNTAAGVQLGWEKIEGATGYAIYRKSYSGTDAWARIATIEGNEVFTWTDTSVKNNNGEIYKYTIRALAGSDLKTLSGCRNAGRTMVRLSSQYIKSMEATGSNAVKLSWSTSSRVTGYEVRFLIDGEVYKTFTVGNYKTGVKTFTGLKAGQTYTVQVRTYKKVDGVGSFYSDWSKAWSIAI